MSLRTHIGAVLERPPGPRYTAALRFGELAIRSSLPRPATLRRWRASLPDGFRVALRVPPLAMQSDHGVLCFDERLERGVQWVLEAAEATDASLLVVATGSVLTTGRRDRDRLSAYFERLRATDRPLVWAPDGLWRPELALRQAERMGVVYAVDPFEVPPPEGPVAYLRLKALGMRSRFSEGMLLDLADHLLDFGTRDSRDCYVAFESPRSFREAVRLTAILGGEAEELPA